ncbi:MULTISPECIES: type 1 glutamine amidotransferase domain-containing protein [Shewanella]|uniref:Type 1 glutamine amidotransferase domain-containing protein n=1 Tax=Shewanella marisflavi TaxID=260364 RepID=A0ABX5WIJ8_9GAMM|nr:MULTISPECIES: type 1 glutamine amidotransferase domain-containing protein [Shewanella]QDF74343.1 type 1 glutamine amidotransferase domain-containing protein [Shewanella marisflavi]
MKKVLIFLTNHATLGTTDEANGTFAPELTHALHELLAAGLDYDLVSIDGGKAPLYGTDIEGDEVNASMVQDASFISRVNNTIPASQIDIEQYSAIYYPGGFGLLSDLATNEAVAQLSAAHYENGGVIGAVCHGPAGLLPITLSNGEKLIADKSVTGFTREEEIDYGTIDKIPFLLEEALTRSAKRYNKVQPWNAFIIEDQRVITGQNPASASAVGKAIAAHLA